MYAAPPPRPLPSGSNRTVIETGSNRTVIETCGPSKRVYQVWKGGNRFFLGGRLIFGPDVRSLVITVFLIVIPVILFAVFVSQKLLDEFQNHLGVLIVAIAVIFTTYILVLLFLTSGRDPGIIPRNAQPPEPKDVSTYLSEDWARSQSGQPTLPATKDVLVNGIIVKVKYCQTCMLYRPPRCSHCSICNNCVERFDHHCPWVGQCIGKRNYRFFFMFVSSTTLLCLYVFAFCWVNLKMIMEVDECSLWKAFLKSPVSGILIIYTFIAAWFVGGLTAFHVYLICTNQTTYENFRYRYDGKMNPYNRGSLRNIKEIFFSRIPVSKNDFRAKVKEVSFAYTSRSLGPDLSLDMTKTSFDVEMGGKRHALVAEDLEDVQSQIESMGEFERCSTQQPHSIWGSQRADWEISSDIETLTAEFGPEHGFTDKERIHELEHGNSDREKIHESL